MLEDRVGEYLDAIATPLSLEELKDRQPERVNNAADNQFDQRAEAVIERGRVDGRSRSWLAIAAAVCLIVGFGIAGALSLIRQDTTEVSSAGEASVTQEESLELAVDEVPDIADLADQVDACMVDSGFPTPDRAEDGLAFLRPSGVANADFNEQLSQCMSNVGLQASEDIDEEAVPLDGQGEDAAFRVSTNSFFDCMNLFGFENMGDAWPGVDPDDADFRQASFACSEESTHVEVEFRRAWNERRNSGPSTVQWEALRTCESSNNYSAVSLQGTYRGAYQLTQTEWDLIADTRLPALTGLNPAEVDPAWQDVVAFWLYKVEGPQAWPVCGDQLEQLGSEVSTRLTTQSPLEAFFGFIVDPHELSEGHRRSYDATIAGVEACLAENGYDEWTEFFPRVPAPVEYIELHNMADHLDEFGYGVGGKAFANIEHARRERTDTAAIRAAARNEEIFDSLDEDGERALLMALANCWGLAQDANPRPNEPFLPPDPADQAEVWEAVRESWRLIDDARDQANADPSVMEAQRQWRQCVQNNGYPYDSREDAIVALQTLAPSRATDVDLGDD